MRLIWGIAQFVSGSGMSAFVLLWIMTMYQDMYVDYFAFFAIGIVSVVSAITNLSSAYQIISGGHSKDG